MNTINPICERIVEIQRSTSIKKFADKLNISTSTVHYYLKGRIPPADFINRLCESFDINSDWLLTGKGPKYKDEKAAPSPPPEQIKIPLYDCPVSAGQGNELSDPEITGYVPFETKWLKDVMDLDPQKLSVISTMGDSMEPTIKDGDWLLVDERQQRVKKDAIYIINFNDCIFAKRLQFTPKGTYIRSDNPAYENIFINNESQESFKIIGRVVWIGKKL